MDERILTTPAVESGIELLRECIATQSIGVLLGVNGIGKTFALRAIETSYPRLNLPGNCYRHRCHQTRGATRGLRDLVIGMGGRGSGQRSGATAGLALFCKFAHAEFRKRDIRTLLLDEADVFERDALAGFVAFFDYCRENEFPITIIMTGVEPPSKWIESVGSGRSRTLRVEMLAPLHKQVLLGIMKEWARPFADLAEKCNNGVKAADTLLKKIHKGTGGNLRRARQFTDLLLMTGDSFELSEASVASAFAKMMRLPGYGA